MAGQRSTVCAGGATRVSLLGPAQGPGKPTSQGPSLAGFPKLLPSVTQTRGSLRPPPPRGVVSPPECGTVLDTRCPRGPQLCFIRGPGAASWPVPPAGGRRRAVPGPWPGRSFDFRTRVVALTRAGCPWVQLLIFRNPFSLVFYLFAFIFFFSGKFPPLALSIFFISFFCCQTF